MSTRVVYLCDSFPVLSETFVSDQVEALLAAGIQVKVLSLRAGANAALNARWNEDPQRQQALETLFANQAALRRAMGKLPRLALRILARPASWTLTLHCLFQGRGFLRDAQRYAAWLDQHPQRGDALVCHFGPTGYVGALLRAWGYLDMPQVTVFHGYDMSRVIQRRGTGFYRYLFKAAPHHSLAITRFWQRRLGELGDAAASWVPLGVDASLVAFRPRAYPEQRPVRLVTVGRLTEKKGQADVLQALARLPRDTAWGTNWEYHLVGTGPEDAQLKALAARLDLQDKVIFHGGMPHTQALALLDASDVFVLTSRTAADGDMEGLPIALMEAMASGMPTLSTRHSGIPELITHGSNGLLCNEGDIDGLRDNLCSLLGQPASWDAMVTDARQTVERDYNLRANVQSFIRFLNGVVAGTPQAGQDTPRGDAGGLPASAQGGLLVPAADTLSEA